MTDGGLIPPFWLVNEYADRARIRPLSFAFGRPRIPFPEIVLFPTLKRATDFVKDQRRRLDDAVYAYKYGMGG